MHLKFDDGRKMRVTKYSSFDIAKYNDVYELKVSSTGKGNFRHVAFFRTKDDAAQAINQIQAAFNRGEYVLHIEDLVYGKH